MAGITASSSYYPGDLIYREESFVQVLPRKLKDIMCEWCNRRPFSLLACKQCLAVKYCGKDCQKNDWSSHRLECKKLKNLPKNKNTDLVRLIGKVILKIKDKEWKDIRQRVFGVEYSFEDIDSHYREMTENPRINLLYKELKELIQNYIGKENMPGDVDLIKIIGKVRYNTFTPLAHYFYIGSAMFDLECIPNASIGMCGRTAKIWATKRIQKGVDKITIPSKRILSLEQPDFLITDKSSCKCSDCSLPYGESILTKILDEKRAYGVISESEVLLNLVSLAHYELEMGLDAIADDLLKRQEGVLGNTNLLRLKMLALKSFRLGGNPLVVQKHLLELEKYMSSVFGELYSEMFSIYEALSVNYLLLGNPSEGFRYQCKAKAVQKYFLRDFYTNI